MFGEVTATDGVIRGACWHDCPDTCSWRIRVEDGRAVELRGAGEFERLSWDEALDDIATRLQQVIAESGAETVLPYSYMPFWARRRASLKPPGVPGTDARSLTAGPGHMRSFSRH